MSRRLSGRFISRLLSICILTSRFLAGSCFLCPSDTYAEVKGALLPTVDEAYYATVDYYGNLLQGSVVKSVSMNGAKELTDYGTYDEIINLTDRTEAEIGRDTATFRFGDDAPSAFYFEGRTSKPFEELPWSITLTYKLNGVPMKAEELAGKKGEVEITLSAVPNRSASAYMRNNYILAAAAAFNMNDFLSVEAPDAQIQTVGNLKTAAFFWLPGEEESFKLRLGTESFEMDGITFLMGPLNTDRLSKVKDLQDMKDDLKRSWDDLNDAADEILDSVDGMKSSLNEAADGLETLNRVRDNAHSHQSAFYGDLDRFLGEMDGLSSSLVPMSGHLTETNNTVTDLREHLSSLDRVLLDTQKNLAETASILRRLKSDMTHVQDVTGDLDRQTHAVHGDIDTLQDLMRHDKDSISGSLSGTLKEMTQLYKAYEGYMKSKGLEPMDAISDGKVLYDLSGEARVRTGTPSSAGLPAEYEGAGIFDITGANYPEGSFQDFAIEKLESLGYDDDAISYAIGIWNYRNDIAKAKKHTDAAYEGMDELMSDLLDVDFSAVSDLAFDISEDAGRGFENAAVLVGRLDAAISELDRLHATIDNYIPELEAAISDLADISDALSRTIGTLSAFLRTTRNIMRENSDALNRGADDALQGTADLLRKSAGAVDATDKARNAKDSIRNLVDDKWDEYTGDKNNLLLLDTEAPPQSLTSDKNRSVTSVSVVIRTQEIEISEDTDPDSASKGQGGLSGGSSGKGSGSRSGSADQTPDTVLGRIVKMFSDIWNFLTGWMRK